MWQGQETRPPARRGVGRSIRRRFLAAEISVAHSRAISASNASMFSSTLGSSPPYTSLFQKSASSVFGRRASQRRERRQMFQKRRLRVLILRGRIGVRVVRGRVVRGRRGHRRSRPVRRRRRLGMFRVRRLEFFPSTRRRAPSESTEFRLGGSSPRLEPPVVRLGERRGGRAASAGDEIGKLFESEDGSFAFGRRTPPSPSPSPRVDVVRVRSGVPLSARLPLAVRLADFPRRCPTSTPSSMSFLRRRIVLRFFMTSLESRTTPIACSSCARYSVFQPDASAFGNAPASRAARATVARA